MSTLDDYRTVLAIVREQVMSVGNDELTHATPCAEWDLAALLGHTLGAIEYYAALARDGVVPSRELTVPVHTGDDVPAMFDASAAIGRDAWGAPGALDREVHMVLGAMPGREALAIHVADLGVHAWDLGWALGNTVELPPALAARALATWQRVFAGRDLRGIVFSDEVAVDADADATTRLLAYCGRALH